jgi:hypothetical protein
VGRVRQAPATQRSAVLQSTAPQALRSGAFSSPQPLVRRHTATLQAADGGGHATGAVTQPSVGEQASTVHGSSSSHERGEPTQTPAWQRPRSSHRLEGMQTVPSGAGVSTQMPGSSSKWDSRHCIVGTHARGRTPSALSTTFSVRLPEVSTSIPSTGPLPAVNTTSSATVPPPGTKTVGSGTEKGLLVDAVTVTPARPVPMSTTVRRDCSPSSTRPKSTSVCSGRKSPRAVPVPGSSHRQAPVLTNAKRNKSQSRVRSMGST